MKQKKVKVRAALDDSGAIDFEVDGVKAKHARLKLDKDSGAHSIDFDLHDQTGKNLQFKTADPVWAGDNVPCPPAPGQNSTQLSVGACDAKTLTLVNANSGEPREVRYQLNFVAADGSAAECDPIFDNGGGNAA
jgi:hypothetical protein